LVEEVAGDGARRRQAAAGAAACNPARSEAAQGNASPGRLCWCVERGPGCSDDSGMARRGEFTAAATMAGGGA
jgi:hypothetical protein